MPGDAILAVAFSTTGSAMAFMGTVGLRCLCATCPRTEPCRGVTYWVTNGTRARGDFGCPACCHCAQSAARLWQSGISPSCNHHFPTAPHPRQSPRGSATSCHISPSKKTQLLGVSALSWWLQASSHQKASPRFSCTGTAPRKVAGAGVFPLHGAPAAAGSAACRDAPREQSLRASSSEELRGVPGMPFTCWLLTNENTHR